MKTLLKISSGQKFIPSALVALLFLLSCQLSHAQANALGIPASEYDALVDLYNSTAGSNWVAQSGWLNPQSTYWTGIIVSGGHVNGIGLENNNLSGSLPASLGNLPDLQSVFLFGNNLTGTIPASLGNLAQLQYLGLNLNQLSGSIPNNFVSLTNLSLLFLEDNHLTGNIPVGFVNLTNLQQLRVSDNLLTGAVPNFSGFSHPLYIDVSSNYLDILPGSQSLANINSMIAAGNTVIYTPQNYPVLGPVHLSAGTVQVGLTAELGGYSIQGSSNLVDWVNLGNINLSNTTGQFLDTSVSNHPTQFYRAVSSP
jgi:Leucine-rich repeat (LRR) protein